MIPVKYEKQGDYFRMANNEAILAWQTIRSIQYEKQSLFKNDK